MSRNKRKAAEETAAAAATDNRRTRSKRGKAEEGEEPGPEDKTTAAITTGDDSKEETPIKAEDSAVAESEGKAKGGDKGEKGLDEASEEKAPAKVATKEAKAPAAAAKAVAKEVEKEAAKKEVAKKEANVAPSKPSTPAETAHWNNMFFQLMLYRVEHGNVNVKSTDDKHKDLYKWIVQLRKDYKIRERSPDASPLTADQIDVLESVRFAFTTRGEEHWQKSYDKLKEYREEHGHVLVPRQCEIPGLGDWVTSQRQQYQDYKEGKPTPLTKQRKDLLDEIGFQWRVRNRPEWTSKFEELLTYKAKHGDTRVPQHYAPNKALGKWVAKQREQFKLLKKGKHSFLTPDRLEKLNGIEFAWAVRGDTADDAGNSDEPAAGGGTVQAESKEEEGAAKKEEEPKPKAVVKKEDGETSGEKKVETVTV